MPLVSIIIPVYNAASTLLETLKSVQSQSFRDFEIVLINDGSTDESPKLIQEWINTSGLEVTLISQNNQGLGASRNRGIEAAKGDWIALLDADDIWHEHKLKFLSEHLQSSADVGVYYHKVFNYNEKGQSARPSKPVRTILELLTNSNPLVPSAVVLRRGIAVKHAFSEDRELHGAEDLHLWVRLLSDNILFQFNAEAITFYRVDGGMSNDLENHLQYVFNALAELRKAGHIDHHIEVKAKARKHYEAGRFYQKKGEFQRAKEHYRIGQIQGPQARVLIVANRLHLAI